MINFFAKLGFGAVALLLGYDCVRRYQKNHHDEIMAELQKRVEELKKD